MNLMILMMQIEEKIDEENNNDTKLELKHSMANIFVDRCSVELVLEERC